ncbi:MAG: discoidin domain-containing protein [Sphingobium sp.]|nr:discoidin domain-containing protein [Sphingobium sp.]
MNNVLRIASLGLVVICIAPARAGAGTIGRVIIDLADRSSPSFRPDQALGAGVDGAQAGDIDRLLTAHNIRAMKSAGLRPLTYRLRTELGIEAWHWNPAGTWSDPAHRQGYWTSSDKLGKPILMSWGYELPRRGDTVDNANNVGYSRLTDGDPTTFWKSNPYLDPSVLQDGQPHPQWLVVRLDGERPVDAARITWGTPFATRYQVQYWVGATEYAADGRWVTFPHGRFEAGGGGDVSIRLADQPVTAKYLRILLETGSGTAPPGATDWRDRAGYAVREVSFGLQRPDGSLDDVVVHKPSHDGQTFTHVSSTDPWHRAIDRDKDLEQTGIDRIFASHLGFGLPIMMPTGLLFDTPDNAAAELRYLVRRGYTVRQVELGEEPDGQYGAPADYGALYLAFLDRLRPIAPHASFGGPSLQSGFTETELLPEVHGSWTYWLADYLKRRDRLADLQFLSFEFYPFDDICGDIHAKLIEQDQLLSDVMTRFEQDGIPASVPKIISEYGFSAYSGRAMSEMPSALLMANIAGRWLGLGGSAAYMFGYGPNWPSNQHLPCAGYGNMMLHMADSDGQARQPMPSYYTARLLTQAWTVPGHGLHRLVASRVEGMGDGSPIALFSVRRPDRKLGVLLVNRSATQTFSLDLTGASEGGRPASLTGPAEIWSYGPAQYAWLDQDAESRPSRTDPPAERHVSGGPLRVELPADSIVVAVLPMPATARHR